MLLLSAVFIVRNNIPNGAVSGKYFWFYCSFAVLSPVTTCLFFISRRKTFRFTPTDIAVFLLCVSGIAINFLGDENVSGKFIILVLLFPLYVYFRFYLSEKKFFSNSLFIFFLILTGLYEALLGLGQLYGFYHSNHAEFKITGSFFNPGPYSGWLAVVFPLAFYHLLAYYRVLGKKINLHYLPFYVLWILSLLTVITTVLALPPAMSRSSWLAAAGGCGMAACLYYGKKRSVILFIKRYRKKLILASVAVLTCLITAGAGMYFLKKDSADGRLLIWKISAKTVARYPFGVGLGNFSGAYGELQAEYFASNAASEQEKRVAGNPEYGFNEYFQFCIEWGIVPFLLFVAIIVNALYSGLKQRNIAVASLVALLIFAAASYPFSVLPFVTALIFLLASCNTVSSPKTVAIKSLKKISWSVSVSGSIFFLLFASVCICLHNRYPLYEAYKKWGKAQILYNAGLYRDASEEYAKQYIYLHDEVRFLFEYSQALNKSEKYTESNKIITRATKISCDPMFHIIAGKNYQSLKDYASAERSFAYSGNLVPSRLYPSYLLAKLYMEMGLDEKARETAKTVLTVEPKINSPAVEEMRREMSKLIENYNCKYKKI
ncbi:MAG: O-antigen ligase family protein [Prevotellaceae bacterium]|nr:O-antigen ligase family protein [Prevotellaceae bacterium]